MTKVSKMEENKIEENKRYILVSELSADDCIGVSGAVCVFNECAIGMCSYIQCNENNVIYLLKEEKWV